MKPIKLTLKNLRIKNLKLFNCKTNLKTSNKTMKNILDLKYTEAREFLLEEKSYCSFDIPTYFKFSP